MNGLIIKAISGFYYVETEDKKVFECKARGKFKNNKQDLLVGDRVDIEIDGEKKYSFCFLWSALDNRVNAYQDGNSGYADERLFVGECEFGRNRFEMDIVEYYDDALKALPEQLKFVRE